MKKPSQHKLMLCGAAVTALTVFISTAPSASAGTIKMQGAESVTTDMGQLRYIPVGGGAPRLAPAVEKLIDKQGLYRAYTNGEDQADYLARPSDSLHTDRLEQEWFSSSNRTRGNITFDLGSVFNVANVLTWNEDTFGIKDFNVFASTNGADFNFVKSFTAKNEPVSPFGTSPLYREEAEIHAFDSSVSARFIRLVIQNAYGYESPNRDYATATNLGYRTASLGEVAFGVKEKGVPTPALLPGLIGLGATAWRKRRQANAAI